MSTEEFKTEEEGEGLKFSFMSHLEELRSRLFKISIFVLAVFLVCYHFSGPIFRILAGPIIKALPKDSSLTIIDVTEAFMLEIKIALIAAVVAASPYIFYQLWKFVSPALYEKERRYVWQFVMAASICFFAGVYFCYAFALPWAFEFFLSYATDMSPMEGVKITANISVKSAVSLALQFALAFGAVFELPVVVYFLARMGVITHKTLSSKRPIAVVIIFIVAAILTPPDVMSQLLMAGPLLVLYEISIVVAWLFGPKPEPDDDEADQEA